MAQIFQRLLTFLLLLGIVFPIQAQHFGPEQGKLIIAGGGSLGDDIIQTFIDDAGGPDAAIVVIPTAIADGSLAPMDRLLTFLRNAGATNLTLLHTRDRKEADSEAFVAPLTTASGVWFTGGRQWRIADSYLGTRTEEALWEVLARGGVIGGSSAGATIQGSYLARGDSRTNMIMMGDHEEGFGFLQHSAIDQHLLARNRQFDLLEILYARPDLIGIGLDEGTAIRVMRNGFEVIGRSYVALYTAFTLQTPGRFHLLRPGTRFTLAEGEYPRSGRPDLLHEPSPLTGTYTLDDGEVYQVQVKGGQVFLDQQQTPLVPLSAATYFSPQGNQYFLFTFDTADTVTAMTIHWPGRSRQATKTPH